jgi:hypothetical protein
MNWLGAGLPALLASMVGAALGAFLHVVLLRHGFDFPPLIALIASLGAVISSKEASGLRGILVASMSCWAGAIAEVLAMPQSGFVVDLGHFSDRLTVGRLLLYVASALAGIILASRARRGGMLTA